jgi:hypothetical protein
MTAPAIDLVELRRLNEARRHGVARIDDCGHGDAGCAGQLKIGDDHYPDIEGEMAKFFAALANSADELLRLAAVGQECERTGWTPLASTQPRAMPEEVARVIGTMREAEPLLRKLHYLDTARHLQWSREALESLYAPPADSAKEQP